MIVNVTKSNISRKDKMMNKYKKLKKIEFSQKTSVSNQYFSGSTDIYLFNYCQKFETTLKRLF